MDTQQQSAASFLRERFLAVIAKLEGKYYSATRLEAKRIILKQ
jgi:hypothetical protein